MLYINFFRQRYHVLNWWNISHIIKKKERQKREFRCTLKCINMSVWRKTNNVKNPTNLLARYRIESASLIFTSTIFQFQTYKYICRWKAIYVDLKSRCKMLEFPTKISAREKNRKYAPFFFSYGNFVQTRTLYASLISTELKIK